MGEDTHDAIDTCQSWRGKHHSENRRKGRGEKALENLGFVAGGNVTVITTIGGNVIVNVKEARVAISKEMAQKIMI